MEDIHAFMTLTEGANSLDTKPNDVIPPVQIEHSTDSMNIC